MKVVFVSNFMNHHQLPLCNYLYKNTESFYFIETCEMSDGIKAFGYDDLSSLPYVISNNSAKFNSQDKLKLVLDADAVIFGADSDYYINNRMAQNKLSFVFSERLWKKGYYRRFIPAIKRKVARFIDNINKELYVLCASCYLAGDLSLIGFDTCKCYKWGYFTPVDEMSVENLLLKKPKQLTLIWVGRFIPLKHCEDVLKAVKVLVKKGYDIKLNIVGGGILEEKYKSLIKKYKIENAVELKGSMSQQKVREEMKNAHALIFSSNFIEGWGAVVNEAMNSACVPIVSHAVGSSRFLINDAKNGFIYKYNNVLDLVEKIEKIYKDRNLLIDMGKEAYNTIINKYNGEIAGERLVGFIDKKLKGEKVFDYKEGPLSSAPVIKNNWIKKQK